MLCVLIWTLVVTPPERDNVNYPDRKIHLLKMTIVGLVLLLLASWFILLNLFGSVTYEGGTVILKLEYEL